VTWARQFTRLLASLSSVDATCPTTAWVASWSYPYNYFGELSLGTHDGGATGIHFVDASNGWALGSGPTFGASTTLFRTTTGGR
jgi:hypothetical protein